MNQSFREHVDRLPDLMDALTSSPMHDWHNLRGIPSDGAGIYVFYENGLPIYVGRTRKMRQRIRSHGYKGSRNNSASFAFNLAKKNAETRGVDVTRSRSELDEDPAFKSLFDAERERESEGCPSKSSKLTTQ